MAKKKCSERPTKKASKKSEKKSKSNVPKHATTPAGCNEVIWLLSERLAANSPRTIVG